MGQIAVTGLGPNSVPQSNASTTIKYDPDPIGAFGTSETGITDVNGVATFYNNYIWPVGATGHITITKGLLIGKADFQTDGTGNARVTVNMVASPGNAINNFFSNLFGGLKSTGYWAIALLIAIAVVAIAIAYLINSTGVPEVVGSLKKFKKKLVGASDKYL
jgi:hypothetical protein